MSSANELTYKQKMDMVEDAVAKLQRSDDVDEAIRLYEKANALLQECEAKIESARGRFAELTHQEEGG